MRCSRETTSGTASSSITKLILISEAPWEIMWILASGMALKTLAAMPGVDLNVLAHQADDRFSALVLHVGEPGEIGGDGGDGLI